MVEGEDGQVEKDQVIQRTRTVHIPPALQKQLSKTTRHGEHIITLSGHAIYNGFTRICAKAGVPITVSMICVTLSLPCIGERHGYQDPLRMLGHVSAATTLDIYTHAFDKNKKAASAGIARDAGDMT